MLSSTEVRVPTPARWLWQCDFITEVGFIDVVSHRALRVQNESKTGTDKNGA
jgi:hypothetical protein